jgi:hypothetical protein
MAALIIEVNHGARHDTRFHRVESLPFTIGRAYDNDLILVDDTVSPHHLQLDSSEDGFSVRNLSSENGTWAGGQQMGDEAHALRLPLWLNLGRTHLKILAPETAVAPTRKFPNASRLTRWASDLRVALGLLSVYLLLSIFFALEKQSLWLNWQEVLVNQPLEIVLPLLMATAVAFVSRMLMHRWRFSLQLSIACIALGILTFSNEVIAVVSYWLTNNQIASLISSLLIAASFVGLLAWQLRAISTLSRKRAGWISLAIIVPLFFIWELQAVINQPTFQVVPPMHTLLKSGDVRLANTIDSIEEFKTSVEAELQAGLKEELEKGALEEPQQSASKQGPS